MICGVPLVDLKKTLYKGRFVGYCGAIRETPGCSSIKVQITRKEFRGQQKGNPKFIMFGDPGSAMLFSWHSSVCSSKVTSPQGPANGPAAMAKVQMKHAGDDWPWNIHGLSMLWLYMFWQWWPSSVWPILKQKAWLVALRQHVFYYYLFFHCIFHSFKPYFRPRKIHTIYSDPPLLLLSFSPSSVDCILIL